ncbi:hypothetical protein [Sphingobium sp. SA916]|uniref:hypothetical protein n=1 Tax=Sphingobium sp. SA916 TaxID=1851207 RepID=UPI000CC45EC0|nr:hypothetical protein [Sphingobium sp. SA916]PNQ03732.1 hypothetical protein A8G00_09830 [Sphingobium sp. SA916]
MEAVQKGRISRSKRKNKPRTISGRITIFARYVEPKLAKAIHDVTKDDLIALGEAKGKTAQARANRPGRTEGVFGWAASLRDKEVGLAVDHARGLSDLRFPETP